MGCGCGYGILLEGCNQVDELILLMDIRMVELIIARMMIVVIVSGISSVFILQ